MPNIPPGAGSGAPDISASSYEVFLEPGQTESVRIYYDSQAYYGPPFTRPVCIWFRINREPWQRMNLEKADAKEGERLLRGNFMSEPLKPGRVLQYRIFNDPNRTPEEDYERDYRIRMPREGYPLGSQTIMILGLLKKPIKTHWTSERKETVGGTYCWLRIGTPDVRTTVRVNVTQRVSDRNDYSTQFETYRVRELESQMVVEPLLPGQLYDRTIRYVDSSGNWWDETDTFTTLQRVVTLTADSVYIIDDGDPLADGEASFMIMFYQDRTPTDAFFLGNEDYKVHDGQTIPIAEVPRFDFSQPWEFPFSERGPAVRVYGPEIVTAFTERIGIRTLGIEHDGLFESDEVATSEVDEIGGVLFLPIPAGVEETVVDATGSIEAASYNKLEEGAFKFSVKYRFSVSYV
jgi:hypothetical protein